MRAIDYTAYCSIYKIHCNINGKSYIGQTWMSIKRRFSSHKSVSYKTNAKEYKNKLYNAIRSYGIESFTISLLTICSTQEAADYWEIYFIEKFDTINNGYNIRSGGSRGKFSQETKDKMSTAKSGEKAPMYGKHHSQEVKDKMSVARKEAHAKSPMSEEVKLQIANKLTGRKASEETKQKMREAHIRRKLQKANEVKYG